ncbi:MAG TPA: hypothetical protein VHA09_05295 [Nitrososphaera sp.]|nr:hypothetical protein [Nitrososphaera sp.]
MTALAGLIHLYLAANSISHHRFGSNVILFLIGGLAQVFWILPILKQWGKLWYSIGLAGTVAFVAIWVVTRIPGNPITHRAGDVDPIDIITEVFQLVFIGLSFAILAIEKRRIKPEIA